MKKSNGLRILACAAALAIPFGAHAAETGGCESFAWPIATELQLMKAADSEAVASGAKLASLPAKAIALTLLPISKITFPVAPTGKLKSDSAEAFGGFVDFDGAEGAGLYQVTLANGGWVDVVQNGKTIHPSAHSGKSDCDGVRKSLRFDLAAGPFSLELSGIKKDSIKFVIRRAE